MTMFHVKTGILLVLVGLFGYGVESTHPLDNIYPVICGALCITAGILADKIVLIRDMAPQAATTITLCVILWCGARFVQEIDANPYLPVSMAETLSALYVSVESAFITSTAFQDEFAEEKTTNDPKCET